MSKKEDDDKEKKLSKTKSNYPALNSIETVLYIVLWITFYGWAVIQIYFISQQNKIKYYAEGYLDEGWITFLNSYKDLSDFEWAFWNGGLWINIVQGFGGHFVVMRIADNLAPSKRFEIAMCYGMLFSAYIFGWFGLAFMLTHFTLQYIIAAVTKSTYCCWISALALIYSLTNKSLMSYVKSHYRKDRDTAYTLLFSTAMCNLRYIAFSLEYVWQARIKQKEAEAKKSDTQVENYNKIPVSYLHLLMYEFYYPLCYGGPIINYDKFCLQIKNGPVPWDRQLIILFLLGCLRSAFWQLFIEFALHYMYFCVIEYEYEVISRMPMLAFCGLALCQVQFFCMKYVVMYGFPSHFSLSDNLLIPGGPHCVSSKHRFTDMWKYFDKGLHKWLVRYIFIPLGGSKGNIFRSTLSSILPFLFVFYWHGATKSQFQWAMLNWFGVYMETIASKFYKSERYDQIFGRLSLPNQRRLHAMFSSVLFSLLIVSNLYFLSGSKGGNINMKRVYTENIWATLCIHIVLYFGVQTSMEYTRRFEYK